MFEHELWNHEWITNDEQWMIKHELIIKLRTTTRSDVVIIKLEILWTSSE